MWQTAYNALSIASRGKNGRKISIRNNVRHFSKIHPMLCFHQLQFTSCHVNSYHPSQKCGIITPIILILVHGTRWFDIVCLVNWASLSSVSQQAYISSIKCLASPTAPMIIWVSDLQEEIHDSQSAQQGVPGFTFSTHLRWVTKLVVWWISWTRGPSSG